MNKGFTLILVAMAAGLAAGFVLSELIGGIGYLIYGKAVGIKYLPFILLILGAVIAIPIVLSKRQRNK